MKKSKLATKRYLNLATFPIEFLKHPMKHVYFYFKDRTEQLAINLSKH